MGLCQQCQREGRTRCRNAEMMEELFGMEEGQAEENFDKGDGTGDAPWNVRVITIGFRIGREKKAPKTYEEILKDELEKERAERESEGEEEEVEDEASEYYDDEDSEEEGEEVDEREYELVEQD